MFGTEQVNIWIFFHTFVSFVLPSICYQDLRNQMSTNFK